MKPKIALTTAATEHAVCSSELKNWADVTCSYTRSGYGGVVRKFTSQFEFAGDARDFLLGLYLADGVEAQCTLAVYTLGGSWEYTKEFECPLDFSTVKWDEHTLTISAVDSSVAAMLKSAKSTKYEMAVGEDIVPDSTFRFDRITMTETATYAFTQGASDASGAIACHINSGELPWIGLTADELCIGGVIYCLDDQDADEEAYVIKALTDTDVVLSWDVVSDRTYSSGAGVAIRAEVIDDDTQMPVLFTLGGETEYIGLGRYDSLADLEAAHPASGIAGTYNVNSWAVVGTGDGEVYISTYNPSYTNSAYWRPTGKTREDCTDLLEYLRGSVSLSLRPNQKVRITADFGSQTASYSEFKLRSSKLTFSWMAKGKPCDVAAFSPKRLADTLLAKAITGPVCAEAVLSSHDPRLAATRVMAAESIRGIDGARLYTSFGELCDWMEAVFGYVYRISETKPPRFSRRVPAGQVIYRAVTPETIKYPGETDPSKIVYVYQLKKFFYLSDGLFYISFDGWRDYMDTYNMPLADVVYDFAGIGPSYFELDGDGEIIADPQPFTLSDEMIGRDYVTVQFLHRSELFCGEVAKEIGDTDGLAYSIDASQIFASVEAGYEKKDYDSVNGRDEFNFSATYTTGSTVSDKKLSLMSKYRADCYGIEFAAQKRGEDTTDTDSDQDVFFVLCAGDGTTVSPDRTAVVDGALSGGVFNAAFTPAACVRANAGYIAMQSCPMTLAFASSTGNSGISVDGEPVSADIVLDDPMLTCGAVEFETCDLSAPSDVDGAVAVTSGGMRYTGYISDLDLKYVRSEAAKYKLIVKTAEIL